MSLSEVAIRRPVFTGMMALCLMVLGLMGLGRLGTDLYPDVALPVVVVTGVYKGAGPGEVETQVVKPIEDAVAGISGIDKIHSFSRENAGEVVVSFKLSENLDRATQEVREKVSGVVSQLPKGADTPTVSRVDLSAQPILTYAVSGELSSQALRKLVEDRVQPALQQLEGVAQVNVTGGDRREIAVELDLDRARAAGISPLEVSQRIAQENVNVPAGHLQLGPTEMAVRSLGEFSDVEQLRRLPLVMGRSGTQVQLGEVASVTDTVAERRTIARLNGKDAIVFEVVKQPGANTVQVSDQSKAMLAQLSPELGHGFRTTLLIDQSELIRENAREVWVALVFGGLMAVLIILTFLLDPRGTFISSLALPTSVVGTFFVMYVLGFTLNQMTLLALSLAIGLLIDDAVVVREAITHRLEQGEEPMQAASLGTKDVGLAVLATTLTLVAVFIPVAFMSGIVGQFFRQFGITISAAVLISLFISFTLDPMLSARLAKARRPGEKHVEGQLASRLRALFEATERGYSRVLAWALSHKAVTALASVLLLVLSLLAAGKFLGSEFLSVEDRSQMIVNLELPDQSSLALTEARTQAAEKALKSMREVTDVYAVVGPQGDVNKARLRVIVLPKQKRTRGILALKDEARRLLAQLPATRVTVSDPPTLEGLGDYPPIIVIITGPDMKRLGEEGDFVASTLKAIPGTADVKVQANPPKPELQVAVDRTRAMDFGVQAGPLGQQLRLALNGEVAAKLRQGKDETDIRVRLREQDRSSPERVGDMDLFTPGGTHKLSDVARVSVQDGPSVIEHENRERQISVASQLATGGKLGDIAVVLEKHLLAHKLPAGYGVIYDGQIKTLHEQNDAFGSAFGLAFVFIFMVLASQFESLKHPFTIMVALPLALVGAVVGLMVTGKNMSLGAMIGIILLMGLVTKNAILLVDGALQNIRAGDDAITALMKAGPRRLRPILMTSAAMVIGMVPTAIGSGTGSEFRGPMAIAVIGGVITSTFLTLLVVPVVFVAVENLRWKRLLAYWPRRGRAKAGLATPSPDASPTRAVP
jgi:hydrophobic/amphiphilic exporter-1 (mainly G- bacteria), HAE1 family